MKKSFRYMFLALLSLNLFSCSSNEKIVAHDWIEDNENGLALKVEANRTNKTYALLDVYIFFLNNFDSYWEGLNVEVTNGSFCVERSVLDDRKETLDHSLKFFDDFPSWKYSGFANGKYGESYFYYKDVFDFGTIDSKHGWVEYRFEYYDKDAALPILEVASSSGTQRLYRKCSIFYDVYDNMEVKLYEKDI